MPNYGTLFDVLVVNRRVPFDYAPWIGMNLKVVLQDPLVRDELMGVIPADVMQDKQYPGAYVVNTDPAEQSGQHWVAF